MKTNKTFYLLGLSVLLYTCSSNSTDNEQNPMVKLTYDADIKSIMTSNCTQCHGIPTSQGAPFSLTTYTDVKSRANIIISRINNAASPMPPTGLISSDLRENVQQWKDEGLLEN